MKNAGCRVAHANSRTAMVGKKRPTTVRAVTSTDQLDIDFGITNAGGWRDWPDACLEASIESPRRVAQTGMPNVEGMYRLVTANRRPN